MSLPVIDQEARDMARAAQSKMDAHEAVCAERWGDAKKTMGEIKAILAWGGGTSFLMMIGLIGWLASRAF